MLQPGLSRAIPMAIVGFLVGAALVIVIRLIQGIVPAWDVGVGIVFAALFTAAFFIWGMGGFDPRMSVHGEEHDEEAHAPAEEVPAKPFALLSNSVFQLTSLLLGMLLLLFFVALLPGGPALTITQVPLASRTAIGFWEVNAFGQTFLLSELIVFLAFIGIMMLSLVAAAGVIGWGMNALTKGIVNAKAATYTPLTRQLVELPALAGGAGVVELEAPHAAPASSIPDGARLPLFVALAVAIFAVMYLVVMPFTRQVLTGIVPIADDTIWMWSLAAALGIGASIARPRSWVQPAAIYLSLVFLLYPIFYHVAVGLAYLAFPTIGPITPEVQRVAASLINALLIPAVILRPKWVSVAIGRIARALANFLRWVGTVR